MEGGSWPPGHHQSLQEDLACSRCFIYWTDGGREREREGRREGGMEGRVGGWMDKGMDGQINRGREVCMNVR